ncbi:metal-dependent transcriptional regulator [Demequina sp. NBRC 110052]|uniref:metal-dependent transcriptional regulator n=1 Tax=Demequina sp. NBRC 110052 TaxID=1570341 RepID=UPI000A058F04|nr:metal-dependent transcriptional regulator [Demequina sp. NBRC 110052]
MSDLIDTTEMYLRTIYELIEDGVVPMRARIAEQLGHSGPTVSQTVARMERDGLVIVAPDRTLELTPEGEAIATRVMRKHRLAERLLTDVIGLDLAHVHEEACRWEHVMSDRVERRLVSMLEGPAVSPYGNPIPGLAELGLEGKGGAVDTSRPAEMPLTHAVAENVTRAIVVRIGENPQAHPGFLDDAVAIGLVAGASVQIGRSGEDVEVQTAQGSAVLERASARHVFVLADVPDPDSAVTVDSVQ